MMQALNCGVLASEEVCIINAINATTVNEMVLLYGIKITAFMYAKSDA
ncbi:MAG: hypothetical protein ACJA2E_000308 [Arenicella sp.]|jgi:hypothetical protein